MPASRLPEVTMTDVATAARDRIRRFSQITWIAGSVVVLVAGLIAFPAIWYDPYSGQIGVQGDGPGGGGYEDRVYPWLEDEPVQLTIEDGIISGDQRGGYLDFPADATPLLLSLEADSNDLIGIRQSPLFPTTDRYDLPESLGYLWYDDEPIHASPAHTDGRLWISTALRDWAIRATPVDTVRIGTTHSGEKSAVLEYSGDALSARFTHDGDGIFRVSIASPGEYQLAAVNGVDDVNATASWNTAGRTLFIIDADDATGTWTVTVHE